ncbi:glycophorin-A [Ornithorhynchus anatinus]|uniref:glycophorin-A n=1 Tax=Ornithorhynchus anatinus TaxID=9258 RepID=UPI0010A91D94|nr:glycophorin-A [Ornithorhynchus anatinus]
MRMFERKVLVFLLLRLISTFAQLTDEPQLSTGTTPDTPGAIDPEIEHIFTGPVAAVIIYAVVCGVIGTILFIALVIKVVKKKSFNVQPTTSEDPNSLSSVETKNPEK